MAEKLGHGPPPCRQSAGRDRPRGGRCCRLSGSSCQGIYSPRLSIGLCAYFIGF